MNTFYCISSQTTDAEVTSSITDRASSLGSELVKGDPTGKVTVFPSVAITSSAIAEVVIPDDTGQATLAEVQAAQTTASNAETSKADKIAAANTALQSVVAQLAPGLAQAQTDITTLATSTDPNAPIISRAIEAIATLAQAVADALVYLEIIS